MDIDHTEADPLTDSLLDNILEMKDLANAGPGKRKSDEANQRDGKENGSMEKRPKTDNTAGSSSSKPLVELRGRRFIYNETAAPWDIPKRRLLRFDMVLLDHEEDGRKLSEIPVDFYDIVVMAGHGHVAATEATLVKAIRNALSPRQTHLIPADIVAPLVSKLFTQRNYGLVASDFPSTSSSQIKIPTSLQVRRWEAIEPEKYFPAEHHSALHARRAEYERVRAECLRLLSELDDVEARDLIKSEKEEKAEKKEKKRTEPQSVERESVEQSPRVSVARTSREGTAATNDSRRSASPSKKSKMTPEEEEAARLKREEREARKAAQAEKKAARELELQKKEEEKAKQEAVKAKQANMFGSFFKPKPKATAAAASPTSIVTETKREGPPELSEFHQVFKPHVIRPGTRWAPTNKWAESSTTSQQSETSHHQWTPKDFLQDHMSRHKHKLKQPRTKLPAGLKSGSSHSTVGEVWLAHQEAADPRKVLSQLRKAHKYPWKFLAFDQQARPPYSGTFTKKSASVGPRTPFAQDPIFDYTYDSGDDWEEDEGGEDVDDFGEAKPDEEEDVDDDVEEEDDEFADWLDDEEDAGYAPMPVDDDDDPLLHAAPASRQERLPVNPIKKADKPRKIVKVTPWFRGPIWESEIGKHSEFAEYRLQLLNDTPDSFDPFRYISNEQSQAYKSNMSTISMGPSVIPCLIGTTAVNPPPIVAAAPSASEGDSTAGSAPNVSAASSKSRAAPKFGFPTSHLNELFNLIHGNTKIQTDLVSQLRQHFEAVTSKAAIEAKVREVAVREGKTKDSKWKVKPEAWTAAGLIPPAEAPPPSVFVKQTEA